MSITLEHLSQVILLEQRFYGSENTRTAKQLDSLMKKQAHGIHIILDGGGNVAGSVDIWSLNSFGFYGLREGTLREEDINPSWLVNDVKNNEGLYYIGSILMDERLEGAYRKKVSQLLKSGINDYFVREMDMRERCKLLGVVSTESGRRLAHSWGMYEISCEADVTNSQKRVELLLSDRSDFPFLK